MSLYIVRAASWQEDGLALRAVREAVFIREQGVPAELEWDEFDVICVHLLAMNPSGNPIGTARLLPDASIGRMAVLGDWRCKGVGSALMDRLLKEAENRQLPSVTLNAQTHAIGFYSRFGFQQAGPEFLDAGIPHVKMMLQFRPR
ncbi:GNAT family N-acetyltransferase [Nitrosospira multiformis]|nr:GNAT family N-acetyltransferase [Nitrosospira multiformis]